MSSNAKDTIPAGASDDRYVSPAVKSASPESADTDVSSGEEERNPLPPVLAGEGDALKKLVRSTACFQS
jgi:hypothetical protein